MTQGPLGRQQVDGEQPGENDVLNWLETGQSLVGGSLSLQVSPELERRLQGSQRLQGARRLQGEKEAPPKPSA